MPAGVADGALIIDTRLDNSGFIRNANQFRRAVEGLKASAERVGRTLAWSADGYIRALNQASGATRDLDRQIRQLETEAARLQRGMSAAGASEGYKALGDQIKATEEQIDALQAKQREWADMGIAPDSAPFEALDQQIFELLDRLDALKAKQQDMESSGDAYAPGLEQMKADYAEIQRQLEALRAARDEALSTPPGWKDMATVTGAVAAAMERVQQAMATALYAFQHPAEAIDRGFAAIATSAVKAASAIARLAGSAALGFLRRLAEGAKNAAIQFARLASGAMQAGVARLGSGFKSLGQWIAGGAKSLLHFNRANSGAAGGLNLSLKNVLKYAFGIRSLYVLFNRLRTAVKEGMGEIAKQNPTVNAQLKTMKAALNGLKGSLATAFAPIFSAVAPALTRLINMLTSAINAIGAFIAALTGQRTYQKAVAGISGAGDAASSAGSAASDAADAYKDLKREIASFDELDVLGSADKNSSGSGGGGGGISYETEEIASGITDFIGKLKQMWADADYEGIGRTIAGTINSAFAKAKELISWSNLEATVTQAVNGITGVFNGLVDGVDWTLIGETFGEGVNTIIEATSLLLTGIDWENLGKSIAEGLNGLVDAVEWEKLGGLFSEKLNALIDIIKGAVTNFDWENAGKAFAATVNGLFDGVEWDDLKETVTKAINGVVKALKKVVEEFKWGQAGETLVGVINGLFDGVKWDDLKAVATGAINGILATMKTLVSGFRWANAGENIANAINQLFDGVKWDDLKAVATGAINGILATMKTLVSGFRWANAGENIARAINGLFDETKWDDLKETATGAINGILATMKTLISGFRWANAGETFGNTLNGLFSGTEWTTLGETAAAAIAGPLETIKTAVQTFQFGDAAKDFADAVNSFFSNEQMWADAGTIVSDSIKGLFTWGTDFLNNLKIDQISNDIKIAFSKIDWPGIADAMWKFLKAAIAGLGKGLTDLLSPIQEEADDYEIVIGATGEVYFVPKPGEGLHVEGDHWELDEEVNADAEIDPTLPPNADKLLEDEWAAQNPSLSAEVDLTKGEPNKVGDLYTGDETKVQGETSLTQGTTGNQKVADLYTGNETKVQGETSLKQGTTGNQKVGDLYTGSEVTVKGETSLTQGTTGKQKVADLYTGKETTVKGVTSLTQGKTGKQKVGDLYTGSETKVKGVTSLTQGSSGHQTAESVYSSSEKKVAGKVSLVKSGWTTIADFVGTAVTVSVTLSSTIHGIAGFVKTIVDKVKEGIQGLGKAEGGAITNSGHEIPFARGGVIRGSVARYLSSVPHYAGGTSRAHGTVFVAGEAGPEIMGHINGRTEILNKSQLADAMYAAVVAGMGKAVNALGRYLANQMAICANAITASIGNAGELAAVAGLRFNAPALASGTVLPYEVAAQVARSTVELQRTLDANNEDLIQTIISVAGQIVAAVQAQGNRAPATGIAGGMTARQIIDDINRQAQMLGSSPLLD